MSFLNSQMTKLDAVNICLSSMGEPTVNTLDGAAVDAQMASDLVDETCRSVQGMGWHWNYERHTISPDVNGNIQLPQNTLRIDTIQEYRTTDVVQRGGKLFDVNNASYTFTEPLKVELFVLLPFEEIPFAAQQFITIRSARLLQQRILGSDTLSKYHMDDEGRAWIALMQEEADTLDANMLDAWQTQRIVSRGYFARGSFQ